MERRSEELEGTSDDEDKLKFVRKRQINRIQMNSKIHRGRIYRLRKREGKGEGKSGEDRSERQMGSVHSFDCHLSSARCEL